VGGWQLSILRDMNVGVEVLLPGGDQRRFSRTT
jgi:hypothetical protein